MSDVKAHVIKPYHRPYDDPISVAAGAPVTPDFEKDTDIAGWVWCTADNGRSGWTPQDWLEVSDGQWRIVRDFSAIELTISPGEELQIIEECSGFFWVQNERGDLGWVPCDHVRV